MFEAGFAALLATNPGVMAQLGGSPWARADGQTGVFPVQVPEEATLPNIVYLVVGRRSVNSLAGTNRLVMKRVQVDARAGITETLSNCKRPSRIACCIFAAC